MAKTQQTDPYARRQCTTTAVVVSAIRFAILGTLLGAAARRIHVLRGQPASNFWPAPVEQTEPRQLADGTYQSDSAADDYGSRAAIGSSRAPRRPLPRARRPARRRRYRLSQFRRRRPRSRRSSRCSPTG